MQLFRGSRSAPAGSRYCIPANSHALGVSLTPSGWKLRHAGSRLRANFSRLIEKCELLPSCLINFQKCIYVNSDPCKERKPCVKWVNNNTFLPISVFWSEKHWEWACVYTRSKMRGLFPLSSQTDVFGRLRTFSGLFGNDRVVFKNLSTPRIKILKKLAGIILYITASNGCWIAFVSTPEDLKGTHNTSGAIRKDACEWLIL